MWGRTLSRRPEFSGSGGDLTTVVGSVSFLEPSSSKSHRCDKGLDIGTAHRRIAVATRAAGYCGASESSRDSKNCSIRRKSIDRGDSCCIYRSECRAGLEIDKTDMKDKEVGICQPQRRPKDKAFS